MKLYILDLPNEILLHIISFKYNLHYDCFKNIRYLMRLSKVCKKLYDLCHEINKEYLFFTVNYISLCNGLQLYDDHYIFSKNIINNWSNINIILSFNFIFNLK